MTSMFLFGATGYYHYDHGYMPQWKGVEEFQRGIITIPEPNLSHNAGIITNPEPNPLHNAASLEVVGK